MSEKQHIITKTPGAGFENLNVLEIFDPASTPSWQRSTKGTAIVKVTASKIAGWVQFVTTESPENGNPRTTFFTFNKESAIALRDFLNKSLPQ